MFVIWRIATAYLFIINVFSDSLLKKRLEKRNKRDIDGNELPVSLTLPLICKPILPASRMVLGCNNLITSAISAQIR